MAAVSPPELGVVGYAGGLENFPDADGQLFDSRWMVQTVVHPVHDQEVPRGDEAAQLLPVAPVPEFGNEAAIAVKDKPFRTHHRGE